MGHILPDVFLHDLPSAVTRSLAPYEMEAFDGWIIQERVLCHRLEARPRLPAPAACTPLETNQCVLVYVCIYIFCSFKTRFPLQQWGPDCGPVSLTMVAQNEKLWVKEEQLTKASKTNKVAKHIKLLL